MYEPGWFGQPEEFVERKPQPAASRSGPSIGPTDFGARDAAEADLPGLKRVTTPMVIDPPDGRLPLQPAAAKRRAEIMANQDKAQHLDPRVRCLPSGVPRANMPVYYNSYQILQKPGYVVIVYEWNHMTRIIPLDGRPHLDKSIRLAMGDSRGRWEGNTLVVDVTNFKFNGDTWILGHGSTGHGLVPGPDLHVVERFTPIDRNVIRYEARIEDPTVFTRPVTLAFDAMIRGARDHQIFEYACHEGNRDGILLATGVDIDPDKAAPDAKKK
jgi:hypothetical protein